MHEERVEFVSEGTPVVGILRRPAQLTPGARLPAVVFCAGMSLTKEVWLPPFAERLVQAGYVTLNFDYRGFGESGGQPRRRLIPAAQVRDVRNALTFVQTRPEVDPQALGLFGVSLGCPVAVGAASADDRVRALVAAAGPGHLGRVWSAFDGFPAFRDKVWRARQAFVARGEVSYVSVAKLLKSDPETCALLEADAPKYEHWDLTITFESLADLFEFAPETEVAGMRGAALYAYPEADALIARMELASLHAHTRSPKRLLALEGAKHVDVYAPSGPAFDALTQAAQDWFRQHLVAEGAVGL